MIFETQRNFAISQIDIYHKKNVFNQHDFMDHYYDRLKKLIMKCHESHELLFILETNFGTLFIHPSLKK